MSLADLLRDDITGRLSHTKLWIQISVLSVTVMWARAMWLKPESISEYQMIGYVMAVGLALGTSAGTAYLKSKRPEATNGTEAKP